LTNLNDSPPTYTNGNLGHHRRWSSLTSRFPGDNSHQPLAILAKEKYIADRSAHMVKKHHIHPDIIDALDNVGGASYHHPGPYDATLYARNNNFHTSPVQAVAGTNAEALKATPREKIIDSVQGHRPLDGVASFPPGTTDRNGHIYQYEEGDNMMIGGGHEPEGGAYKRWPGVQYSKDDIKGKGEPSYSIEKALKENEKESKKNGEGEGGIEMTSHQSVEGRELRNISGGSWGDAEGDVSGTAVGSFSKRLSGGGLRKRIGSIKKHLHGSP
jgi:Pal1 cell morphology protein